MFALFLLGGLVVNLIPIYLQRAKIAAGLAEAPDQLKVQAFGAMYHSEAIGEFLAKCPTLVYFLFEGTMSFLPLFILLVGFDQIAGDIQHRTIRYSAGRADRISIVTGKALGVWAVNVIMIFVLHLTVWVVLMAQGMSAGLVLSWGLRLWLITAVSAASYVGFTMVMSALVRTPVVALFMGAGIGFALWITTKILMYFETARPAAWILPGSYVELAVSPEPARFIGGLAAYLAWGAAMTALAALLIRRKDI